MQPRPRGVFWPSSREWKLAVIDQLDVNARAGTGVQSRSQLARSLGVSTAGVTQMLRLDRHPQQQTRLKPLVHAVLGWPPPDGRDTIVGVDEYRATLNARWPELSPSERAQITAIAVSLTERRR